MRIALILTCLRSDDGDGPVGEAGGALVKGKMGSEDCVWLRSLSVTLTKLINVIALVTPSFIKI